MQASLSWAGAVDGAVIRVRGVFDRAAAEQLEYVLPRVAGDCVVDFGAASDVQLHALGTLLEVARPGISLLGLRGQQRLVVESFGFALGPHGELLRRQVR